jgi:glycerophosphoryl diester phosphodiesterase
VPPAWLLERPVAHRGLHDHSDGVPENSLAAFEAAAEAGYPIELDVRLTADMVPVVCHDERLDRLCGVDRSVAESSRADLADLTLLETDQAIPTLKDTLEAVDGRVPVLVEVKNRERPGPVERGTAEVLDDYDGRFAVQSFNPLTVGWFRRHRPDWPRGQVAGTLRNAPDVGSFSRFVCRRLLASPLARPGFVAYEHNDLPYWPVTLHRRLDVPVLAWTIRSRADLERARAHADNVIFESIRP